VLSLLVTLDLAVPCVIDFPSALLTQAMPSVDTGISYESNLRYASGDDSRSAVSLYRIS